METTQACPFHPDTPLNRGFAFLIIIFSSFIVCVPSFGAALGRSAFFQFELDILKAFVCVRGVE